LLTAFYYPTITDAKRIDFPINIAVLPLSLLVLCLYFIFITHTFAPLVLNLLKHQVNKKMITICIIVYGLLLLGASFFVSYGVQLGAEGFLTNILHQAITNPAVFLVAHSNYFGVGVLFIFIFYKSFVKKVISLGTGYAILILFYSYIMIGSESRQFINILPFLILPVMLLLKEFALSKLQVISVITMSIVTSKWWYPINQLGGIDQYYFQFPSQHYFMNQGPWLATPMYLVQLLSILVLCAVLYFLFTPKQFPVTPKAETDSTLIQAS